MCEGQDGPSRATSFEARHKLCTNETEKSETVVLEGRRGEIIVSSSPTLHAAKSLTRNLRTPADEENAGD